MALDRQKAAQFRNACAAFDVTNSDTITSLSNTLEKLTTDLAKNEVLRQRMGLVEPSIWPELQRLWHTVADLQLSSRGSWDGDEESLRTFLVNLAKFTRNIVAGVPFNQDKVYQNELEIRRLLHHYTSWSSTQEVETFKVTQALVQTVSNIITTNDLLASKLWDTYMNLPEEQVILIRLIASPDARTALLVLIFIVNCIHKSDLRLRLLCTTSIGTRVCISLLDRMSTLYDAEEPSDGAKAFDIGYSLFTRIFQGGMAPTLYTNLSVGDEIIAPHQTTLLKLLDSYLQSPGESMISGQLCPMLSKTFFGLSTYAQEAIRRALGPRAFDGPSLSSSRVVNIEVISEPTTPLYELDLLLPKVCEALVLVTQCIITITLADEDGAAVWVDNEGNELKNVFNEALSERGEGLVESLLELLRLLDLFLPRIHFGKPVPSPQGPHGCQEAVSDPTGFSYLKRDLVRLLGILCQGAKAVQERVRHCGGIAVIMNMCVIDERNPYLREHAILALHNLLEGNPENQAVVDSIKPTSSWDENGELHNLSADDEKLSASGKGDSLQ